jgi:hypothetical protein
MAKLQDTHCHHHFEWGVIFAGTAVATAFSLVFIQFGSIFGFSSDAVLQASADVTHWAVIAIGLWLLATQLSVSALGGYMAGRLRVKTPDLTPHENEKRDGFYGLTVWATSHIVAMGLVMLAGTTAVVAEMQDAVTDLTPELADRQQNAAIIMAFTLGASSLASAALAWAAAALGGDHRDSGADHSHRITFKGR